MAGTEYLEFYGRLYGLDPAASRARGLALFDRFGMAGAAERPLGDYSKGMRQKVGLIRAMLHEPRVLLLDEPTSAMDPHSARMVRDAIRELRDGERAVVLCTHNLPEAELLADRIAIISQGRIIAQGTPTGLKRQLLGDPLFELVLDRPVPDPPPLNGSAVQLVDDRRLRFRTTTPETTNPALVRQLNGAGLGVVTITEVTPSLEDVYLQVVGESTAEVEEQ
jgi:ABC-2 type transport system ATP-binding protein